ncbi:4Fe-4S dicluster domain-containing protein, partial [Enterococcus faecalis]|uniref:4Fe-4S dicluster domain-containing protein n=1 Tax=Enterococcus faecalis TaxID=1351 RepID=UPI003D6B8378
SDGPEEFHVVILDNGRSKAIGTAFQPFLLCIGCGSCLNVCPVYRHIGGHGNGSIYPGLIGAVHSPILGGYKQFGELPNASS